MDGPAGRALPEQRRLALVRDPDRREVARRESRVRERGVSGALDRRPDLLGVVLDPPRPREMLRQLGVAATPHLELRVDHEAGRPGGALVDREY